MVTTAAIEQLARQLFDLARQGDSDALEPYLAAGIPANLRDEAGNTLLMLAAYHGHAATVRMLARHGADVDRLNDDGRSPLAGAVFRQHRAVVVALVDLGASPTSGAPSAVATARLFDQTELLPLLLPAP
jgi:ankyrin repeat protein